MSYRDYDHIGGIAEMRGQTFDRVFTRHNDTELVFENSEVRFVFFHQQDCCESVCIEDIVGDLEDLQGEPLLLAEEVDGEGPAPAEEDYVDSYTWTFYKFATRKGYVDVRWYGTSNGYYSESVDLVREAV